MSSVTPIERDAQSAIRAATLGQRHGADPLRSAWVTASAGSGKTKVLGDRVLRLLLGGTRPERILCLTFTKAAAAEMANRIAETLAKWAAMPQAQLREALIALTDSRPSAETMDEARRLFSRVLDAPGGMKIETIHAFCQSLLRRFPLEAEIAPHFEPMEERDALEMLRASRDAMLLAARGQRETPLARALEHVVRLGEDRLDRLMASFLRERGRLQLLRQRTGSLDDVAAVLARHLGLQPGESRLDILEAACRDDGFDCSGLRQAAALLGGGGKTDQLLADLMTPWLAAEIAERTAGFDSYCNGFFTQDGEPRKKLISKALASNDPGAERALQIEQERLMRLCEKLRAASILADTMALLTLAMDMLDRYERRKAATAQLDFDDLILKTRDLLRRPGIAPWVLFKLDGGLDHILIDEAQDTNPAQWQVIEALAGEFFVGEGAVGRPRTVFAVGDVKQSIYSFQGADPAEFIARRAQFSALAGPGHFNDVLLDVSFRSTDQVLDLVDQVFAGPAAAGVVQTGEPPMKHRVSRVGAAGAVTLWPRAVPVDLAPPLPWAPPRIRDEAAAPVPRLADKIADDIQRLIGSDRLPDRGRPVRAGDILILARSRSQVFEAVVRALKARSIPVAGIDRMHLLDQIAVLDLIAFGDFLLLPEDDLTLATLLKSPLIGLSEEELMALCLDRSDRSLWSVLAERRHEGPAFAAAHRLLSDFLARVDYLSPFALYGDLLSATGGRRRLYARLGSESADAIDEFLSLAQDYESHHPPSLQGFLHWLRTTDVEVKRELQDANDQVRVMTVHGAKGLQAPIVFLIDQQRRRPNDDGLFWVPVGGIDLPLWSPSQKTDHPVTAQARLRRAQAAELEENRLLYVALTRAEDLLYVCGTGSGSATAAPGWYDHVTGALAAMLGPAGDDVEDWGDGWQGGVRQIASSQQVSPTRAQSSEAGAVPAEIPLPGWAFSPAPGEPDPPQPLTPSRPTEAEAAAELALLSPLAEDQGYRFKRGRLIHHLLETLPELPAAAREAAVAAYLARPVHGLDPAQRAAIAAEVLAVLGHPDFADLFGPDSRAEVPVVAHLRDGVGRSRILTGQIDRLVVRGDDCLIVDYKSNRPPPMQAVHVPVPYLRQMAAYRRAVQEIYPDKTIRCVLLWSDGPRLMELPGDMLDKHG